MASALTTTAAVSTASTKAREYGQWLSGVASSASQSAAHYFEERYESYENSKAERRRVGDPPSQRTTSDSRSDRPPPSSLRSQSYDDARQRVPGEGESRWMKLVSAASQAKETLANKWEQTRGDDGYGVFPPRLFLSL
jgi:hypothetical protein